MIKKTIEDISVKGKRVLVRCDFNVPMDEDGDITDDTRIQSAIPTIRYLIDNNARVILMSHLGRPKGQPNKKYSLGAVAKRLSELLKKTVVFAADDEVVGINARNAVQKIQDGDVILLENVRFRKEEQENEPDFAKMLADLGEIFVNDAFGTAHRAHASTAGIADYLPCVSGYLIQRELDIIGGALQNPQRPLIAIMGGAKVSDKIGVIKNLLEKVDTLLIGGGMAYTFLNALGNEIGKSLVESDKFVLAKELIEESKKKNVKLLLPVDVVVACELKEGVEHSIAPVDNIKPEQMGLDIGPDTIRLFKDEIKNGKTIIWNGPMGVFEIPEFAAGTMEIAKALAENKGVTIIGGGDSAAAVEQLGFAAKMTHISTGGGASLKLLEGKALPGIEVIQDK